jgi:mRNA-degrading endonuclease RelE of RelBE toxin-antitoxin system
MDKIQKGLAKLSAKEKQVVKELLENIKRHNWNEIDRLKLTGGKGLFRAKKGSIRIFYAVVDGKVKIQNIQRRTSKTYSKHNMHWRLKK